MQTAPIGHMQFNVRGENLPFYRDLLTFLGWRVIGEWPGMIGLGSLGGQSLWFIGQAKEVSNDYDGPGLNHLAFAAASVADVDESVAWLHGRGVAALFETPRHRPDFSADEQSTYYQVMFETPDRILVEIVYIGPK
jgi:catechol 2,3-dioxygenase-like lactoylglutathione lyase family enzyme